MAPTARLFEAAVCRRYYRSMGNGTNLGGDIPEESCKNDEIQSALALAFSGFKVSSKLAGRCSDFEANR